MKIAYFDCIAGASGDMILGALVDAGLPEATLRQKLADLNLPGFDLHIHRVVKNGFSATKVDVIVADDVPERHLPEIEAVIAGSNLPAHIQQKALAMFRRLGEAEAGIHGTTLEKVHLHELGGMDTIVDIVGALVGLDALGVERVVVSPLPLGRGVIQGAHGQIPLPAPATVALLKDAPVVGSEIQKELVTPTGAVVLTSLASAYGPIPPMQLQASGYGAGGRDLPIPNVLRVILGEQAALDEQTIEAVALLETNIDNFNPELYDYVMTRLFAAGALDVSFSPMQMKKNRPATLLRVICHPTDAQALMGILFAETSTLGIRKQLVERHCLAREIDTVETIFGPVKVKRARLANGRVKSTPEYSDCRRLAEEKHVTLREVYRAAERAADAALG